MHALVHMHMLPFLLIQTACVDGAALCLRSEACDALHHNKRWRTSPRTNVAIARYDHVEALAFIHHTLTHSLTHSLLRSFTHSHTHSHTLSHTLSTRTHAHTLAAALAVRTGVFPTLEDATAAHTFPSAGAATKQDLALQLAEKIVRAKSSGNMHAVFEALVTSCALSGDWTLLPSLVRYFSSAVAALRSCHNVLGTLMSLQTMEMEVEDEVGSSVGKQRAATCMQARGLLALALSNNALHLPASLRARVANNLAGSSGSDDPGYSRLAQEYLHVLLRITARQLFDVFDDVRDAVRVHEATLLASTGGNLHDKDRSGDAADARTRRRRDRGADDDIALRRHHKQTTKTVTLDDGQPCGWNV